MTDEEAKYWSEYVIGMELQKSNYPLYSLIEGYDALTSWLGDQATTAKANISKDYPQVGYWLQVQLK